MPHVTVPEDTFQRLAAKAAALNISVADLIQPTLNQLADSDIDLPLSDDGWLAELDAWKLDAESRSDRYPSSFVVDDTRETIYASEKTLSFDTSRHEHLNSVHPSHGPGIRHRGRSDQDVARERRGAMRRSAKPLRVLGHVHETDRLKWTRLVYR